MSKEDKERDLQDVLREERSRGRKQPLDTDAAREQRERHAAVLEVFRHGTEQGFRELLHLLGFSDQEIEEKLKAFRAARAEL
jgi:hypothetical protein